MPTLQCICWGCHTKFIIIANPLYHIYPKARWLFLRWPPPPKKKSKKNSLLFCTLNTQCVLDSICLYQSLWLSPFLLSVPLSSSHSLLTSFTAIPQHVIIIPFHCIGYTALLKTLHSHFWWDALPCCSDTYWLNTKFIFLGLQTCLIPWRFTFFSTGGFSGVKNLNTRVLDFSILSVV
jgi:hypothetical protein